MDLNKKVAEWICKFGYAYKRSASPVNQGEPDISGCAFGVRIELEGKLPGNTPTKLQDYCLERWKKAGAITGWYTSLKQAQEIVRYGLMGRGIKLNPKYFL